MKVENEELGTSLVVQWLRLNSQCGDWALLPGLGTRLSDPMDYSPPGSSIHGIFQTRVLEWGAIAFSQGKASPSLFQFQNVRGRAVIGHAWVN